MACRRGWTIRPSPPPARRELASPNPDSTEPAGYHSTAVRPRRAERGVHFGHQSLGRGVHVNEAAVLVAGATAPSGRSPPLSGTFTQPKLAAQIQGRNAAHRDSSGHTVPAQLLHYQCQMIRKSDHLSTKELRPHDGHHAGGTGRCVQVRSPMGLASLRISQVRPSTRAAMSSLAAMNASVQRARRFLVRRSRDGADLNFRDRRSGRARFARWGRIAACADGPVCASTSLYDMILI
jgi:hypothetical protein